MSTLIDIGVNLTSKRFNKNDYGGILGDALMYNVGSCILTGTTVNNSKESLEIVKEYSGKHGVKLYSTVGIHPHDAKGYNGTTTYSYLKQLALNKEVVAVGETGLDFDRMFSKEEKQIESFVKHIELSIETNKPLFLHERSAHDKFMEVVEPYKGKIKGVVHCFTGDKNKMKRYLDFGFYIGVTGWVCDSRRNKDLLEALVANKEQLIDRLMVETDAPYLNPTNPREINYPSYLSYVVDKLVEILKIDKQTLMKAVEKNTKIFFNI